LEETTNLASENPELVKQMSEKLFIMLNEMGARFPDRDPEWTAEKEKAHLEKVKNERLPLLEKQRLNFLSKDFDPGNKWWGSEVEKD
jgi:hypothetical protein